MPFELQIIRASEFVRLDPQRHLDLQGSKEALYAIARACRKRGIDQAILDLRLLPIPSRPLFTRDELSGLVEAFRDAGFTHRQRLAVLYRDDPHRGVRKFAFIGTLRGWHVRAFSDFEKAVAWLSSDDLHELPSEARPIPVSITRRKVQVITE
jgi:hypothetical protein